MSTASHWWLTAVGLVALLASGCASDPVQSRPTPWAVAPATDPSSDTIHLQVHVWQCPAPSELDEVHVRESAEQVVVTVTLRSRGWKMDAACMSGAADDYEIIEVDLDEPLGDRDLLVGPRASEPDRFQCFTEEGEYC